MIVDGSIVNGSPLNGSSGLAVTSDFAESNIKVEYDSIFTGVLLPTIYSVKVLHGGRNFSEGLFADISTNNGKILVKQCNKTSIVSVEVIRFGYNYYSPFKQLLYPSSKNYAVAKTVVTNGKVTAVTLLNGGSGYTSPPTIQLIGGDGIGAKVTCTVSGGTIDTLTLVHQGNFYTSEPIILFDDDVAVLEYSISNIRKYPGYYDDSNSLVSDESFIQDGFYFQTYSYEIEVDELFEKYKNIVKQLLHPSGYNMFGAIAKYDEQYITSIAEILNLQIDQYPIDQIFISDSNRKDFYKNILDLVSSVTDQMFYRLTKLFNDSIELDDSMDVKRLLSLLHSVSINDSPLQKHVSKTFSDSTSIILDTVQHQQNFKSVILFDSIIATSNSMSGSYGTTVNLDYFGEDYAENVEAITVSIL